MYQSDEHDRPCAHTQGYAATQDFLEAEIDVKKGLVLEPANAELLALQKRIKVRRCAP